MKQFQRALVLTCLIIIAIVPAASLAETDWEYWNGLSVQGEVADGLSVQLELKYRYKDDGKQHYYSSSALELNYAFLPWLEAGIGYKEVYREKDFREQENRPYAQFTVKGNAAEWKIKNRFRAELRQKEAKAEYYRFRDKVTVKTPWKWTFLEINPYLADEVFLEKEEGAGFNENRVYAGLEMKLAERIALDVYYLYKLETEDRAWTDRTNVIGTELEVSF